MKKAEEYFKEACEAFDNRERKGLDIYDEPYFVAAIKKAQEDAIDEILRVFDIRLKEYQDVKNCAVIEKDIELHARMFITCSTIHELITYLKIVKTQL